MFLRFTATTDDQPCLFGVSRRSLRGLSSRTLHCATLGAILAPGVTAPRLAAAQDARDCEAARNTAIPYELRMRQGDGGTYPVQVYRGKNLTRMQYTKAGALLVIARFQADFTLEYQDLAGTNVRFSYDVPTDRYIWQQERRTVTYNTVIDGAPTAGSGFTHVYEMLPDAVVPVGSCSFAVKHFRFKQATAEKKSDEEVWFSPELDATLRLVETTTSSTGQTTRRVLEAAAIATGIKPFQ